MSSRGQTGLLLVHATLTQAVTFVLRPATSYRAIDLGVPGGWLGVVSASFAVVPLILALPAGLIIDRLGERVVLIGGAVLTCLAAAGFMTIGGSVAGLVVCGVVLGTGHLGAAVGQQALVANRAGPGRYDTAFGYYTFAAAAGQAVGPLLIILFGGSRSIPDTAGIFAGAAVLAGLLLGCALGLSSGTTARQRTVATARGGVRALLRTPGIFRALVTSCVVLAAVDTLLVYLPALGAERGLAAGLVGLLLGLRAVASMISRLFLGRLTRITGRHCLLVVSVGAAAGALGVLALPVPVWVLTIAVLVAGFGLGVGQPLTMSWLAESASAGLRGQAMSLRLTGNRAGQVVIPSTVGFVAAALGTSGVLGITAVALAMVVAGWTWSRRPAGRSSESQAREELAADP